MKVIVRVRTAPDPEASQYVFPNATQVQVTPEGDTLTVDLTLGLFKEEPFSTYFDDRPLLHDDSLLSVLRSLHWHLVENTVNKEVLVQLTTTAIRQGEALTREINHLAQTAGRA